jgi:sec-independent protein translocase protein TatA
MLEGIFQPTHLLLIFGIASLVLGPKKLPELGKGIGESIRGFRLAVKEHVGATDKKTTGDENSTPPSL